MLHSYTSINNNRVLMYIYIAEMNGSQGHACNTQGNPVGAGMSHDTCTHTHTHTHTNTHTHTTHTHTFHGVIIIYLMINIQSCSGTCWRSWNEC